MEKFTKIQLAFVIILSLLFTKCANQLPPTGGDVDRIPPEILEVDPPNGTVNFKGNSFELDFSEYVDKRSVQDAIFISPFVEGGMQYDWSGTSVEVTFNDSLKHNTTYTITVGTDVKDINNSNNLAKVFNFAFSTGPEIDKGEISGKVYTKKTEGVMIFAYRLDSNNINPSKTKPDYVSQISADGFYKLLGLGNTKYRVFAIGDKFRDMLYNAGEDSYGAPFGDILISKEKSKIGSLNFLLTIDDTTSPHLDKAVMVNAHHILLDFSEFIDSSRISADNFILFDSTSNKSVHAKYFYKGNASKNKYYIAVADTFNADDKVTLSAANIFDKKGNELKNESLEIIPSSKPDTVLPKISKILTNYTNGKADLYNPKLEVIFSEGIDTNFCKKGIELTDKNDIKLPIFIKFNDNASFMVLPKLKLKPKQNYKFKIDLNYAVDIAGNKDDSIYTFNFQTLNYLDYSGASGNYQSDKSENIRVVLKSIDNVKSNYEESIIKNKFEFKHVFPGKYILWYYNDLDSSGTYNYGSVYPFKPAEVFGFYTDTLNLRARWPVGDIHLSKLSFEGK